MALMTGKPHVVFDGAEYLILYKPPFMHSASLKQGETGSLSAWCGERFPGFFAVRGKKAVEGGLLHRLDYETGGLVFAALTQRVMDTMLREQDRGLFVKEYEAVAGKAAHALPGFPPRPVQGGAVPSESCTLCVESGFRCYGAGRKSVRPVPLHHENTPCAVPPPAASYQTEIIGMTPAADTGFPKDSLRVRLRLVRGFRHQIRCHLAWIGLPILGDTLYGGEAYPGPLQLNAARLIFTDPLDGAPRDIELLPGKH